MTLRLSVLDLTAVSAGSTPAQALDDSIALARRADALGLTRYWFAEHHNAGMAASAVPSIMIGQVARVTERIRVGSGGVMLPNHSPLSVAESFRLLETMFRGRIDLGIGRAPGTDQLTAFALRRSREALAADDFPDQLVELLAFFRGEFPAGHPFQRVRAVPDGAGTPQVWILGSSGYGAQAAAALGLGAAFAHHIAPQLAVPALRAYADGFTPGEQGAEPRGLVAAAAIVADTDAEAQRLAATADLMWLRLARGESGPLVSPEAALAQRLTPAEEAQRQANRGRLAVGTPETVAARLTALAAEAGVGEVMVLTTVHDPAAKARSYELLADALGVRATGPAPAPVLAGV